MGWGWGGAQGVWVWVICFGNEPRIGSRLLWGGFGLRVGIVLGFLKNGSVCVGVGVCVCVSSFFDAAPLLRTIQQVLEMRSTPGPEQSEAIPNGTNARIGRASW